MTWRRGRHPFRPRLTAEITGYSGAFDRQWCLYFVNRHGRPCSCGGPLVSVATPAAAWEHFRGALIRMGATFHGEQTKAT